MAKRKTTTSKRTKNWKSMSKGQKILYVIVLLVAAIALYIMENQPEEPPMPIPEGSAFEIRFLDVGQADSALITCDGKTLLIDAGNVDDGEAVVRALSAAGVSRLDFVVCTHAHEDHVGGMAEVISNYPVGTVYSSVDEYSTACFRRFVEATHEQGKELVIPVAGDTFDLGSCRVTVLGPLWDYEETNDQSIVLRVVYGETSFLFTGDATKESEKDILADGAAVRSTVLKVGHHGSDTSTGAEWLAEVKPEYAVIPVGVDNDYGHPHREVMERLEALRIPIYRTDTMGMVVCQSDGKTVNFYTENCEN